MPNTDVTSGEAELVHEARRKLAMPRVVHFEIHAADPERAVAFYGRVFGWEFSKWDGPMPYWLIRTGPAGTPGIDGGLVLRQGAPPAEGQAVNAYVCTVDVPALDDSLGKVAGAGGTQVVPKMPIPGIGWLAYVKDTEGNILGLMQNDPSAA
jgi:predicted enzyme related to lactoylglutathione lyase